MKTLPNIHPGEILEEELLKPLRISAYRLAKETRMTHFKKITLAGHRASCHLYKLYQQVRSCAGLIESNEIKRLEK